MKLLVSVSSVLLPELMQGEFDCKWNLHWLDLQTRFVGEIPNPGQRDEVQVYSVNEEGADCES